MLSVAIPSFNRGRVLLQTLQKLTSNSELQVLIVNDGSTTDDYYPVDLFIANKPNFKIHHYSENFGPATALLRLFENCQTEYLMTLSDEDIVEDSNLGLLLDFLYENEFDYLVARDSGCKKSISKLKPKDVKPQSAYFSSNVFKVQETFEALNFIRDLANFEEFAHLYPHTLLAVSLFAQGRNCMKLSAKCHVSRIIEETEIRTLSGGLAHLPTERVRQHLSFLRCLNAISDVWRTNPKGLSTIKNSAQQKFFGTILDSVSTIDARARNDLIRGFPKTYLASRFRNFIK